MRIVALADTHCFHRDIGALPEGDVLLHAGDLLQRGTLEELHDAAMWLRAQPHRHKILIAGNHDWCFQDHPAQALGVLGDSIHYLCDQGVCIDGVRFWGSPWQPTFHNWAFNLPRGLPLAQKWALIPNHTDVLMTHGPPLGMGDRLWRGQRVGCEQLTDALRRVTPALHVFGHIHEDRGVWHLNQTCVANVTTCESELGPMCFDWDVQTRSVSLMQA